MQQWARAVDDLHQVDAIFSSHLLGAPLGCCPYGSIALVNLHGQANAQYRV